MPLAERQAIGHAAVWQLVNATLQVLSFGTGDEVQYACMTVVIELMRRCNIHKQDAVSGMVDSYGSAERVVGGLLRVVEEGGDDEKVRNKWAQGKRKGIGVLGLGTGVGALGGGWTDAIAALGRGMAVRGVGGVGMGMELGMEPYVVGFPEVEEETEVQGEVCEKALAVLCILCMPKKGNDYAAALDGEGEGSVGFKRLYSMLGRWLVEPKAALVGYYLVMGSRKFRTFTLARTDPDAVVVPLLAVLRRKCGVGKDGGDAYVAGTVLLRLTSDKGFCEAIDQIRVSQEGVELIEEGGRLGGEDVKLSGMVMLVCARVVQQSLVVKRQRPDVFLGGVCLAVLANVAADVTGLHPVAAERLVALVEFLGRRRTKAMILAAKLGEMPARPPRISESPRLLGEEEDEEIEGMDGKIGAFERSGVFIQRLSEMIGTSLEVVVGALRARSGVSANKHLVYTLLHREGVLKADGVCRVSAKCEALCHMLGRIVEFLWEFMEGSGGGRGGISVERVFEVIERRGRQVGNDVWGELPDMRFTFQQDKEADFEHKYAWQLIHRMSTSTTDVK